jgi:hypothetical protein
VVSFAALKQQLRSSGAHSLRSSADHTLLLDLDKKEEEGQESKTKEEGEEEVITGRLLRESGEEVIVRRVSNPGSERPTSAKVQALSSTAVRALVKEIVSTSMCTDTHSSAGSADQQSEACSLRQALEAGLKGKVSPPVVDLIVKHRLYTQ